MNKIPIYLKTSNTMERPTCPEYYLMTWEGMYICRNHPFFESDVPTRRKPTALASHAPACMHSYPKIPETLLSYIVGFFSRVFYKHCSEAIVLLLWDMQRRRYRLWVPEQEPTVWESSRGLRSPLDVTYTTPSSWPANHLLVGDMHSHADLNAYSSYTDKNDEYYRDGIHIVVGRIEKEPPEFHIELAVDGYRFLMEFKDIFEGYHRRRWIIPNAWMNQVHVKVKCSAWLQSASDDHGKSQNRPSRFGVPDELDDSWQA